MLDIDGTAHAGADGPDKNGSHNTDNSSLSLLANLLSNLKSGASDRLQGKSSDSASTVANTGDEVTVINIDSASAVLPVTGGNSISAGGSNANPNDSSNRDEIDTSAATAGNSVSVPAADATADAAADDADDNNNEEEEEDNEEGYVDCLSRIF